MTRIIAFSNVLCFFFLGHQAVRAQTILTNAPSVTIRQATAASVQLVWATTNGTFVPETLERLGDASQWQAVAGWPRLESNEYLIAVTVTNAQQFFRLRQVATNALPPNPGSIAPPTDPTLPTTVSGSTEFLYTGTKAIQTGVTSNTIVPHQAGVLRGRVLDRHGAALPGVAITVLDHPELGQTWSRLDGGFDLAVNGGGYLTVKYEKAGYIPAQRQVSVSWQDYAEVPDVTLLMRDAQVTTIDLSSSAPVQVAQGSVSSDQDGARRATLLFAQGTEASIFLPDGTPQPVTNLSIRATEYTVGTNGPRAMPAALPPDIGYTYCVELSADEAVANGIKVGGKDVVFSKPVVFYVENFLGFPVGGIVPVGYYDADRAAWVPHDNGRIIQILSVTGGLADVDIDGDGTANDATSLAALGINDAERGKLANLYAVGQSLWRVTLPHLSTWDCNWNWGPPLDAIAAMITGAMMAVAIDSTAPPQQCSMPEHSVIGIQSQTLGESVGISGTPFRLHYLSSRTPGRNGAYSVNIPVSRETLPASLKRIDLEVHVAGVVFKQALPAQTNQFYRFVWDGRDAYGRQVQGQQTATIRIGYVYDGYYQESFELERAFGHAGNGVPITVSRQEITLWQELKTTLAAWDARAQSLGGWTLDVHHAYVPEQRLLLPGDGGPPRTIEDFVETVAGTPVEDHYWPDGIPATSAYISHPFSVAFLPDGSYYIANGGRVYRVGLDGKIRVAVGNGSGGDGSPATNALSYPLGVAVGPDNTLYIAEGDRIRHVDADGIIHTIAGVAGQMGFNGETGPAKQMLLNKVNALTVGPDGSVYLNDSLNNRIRRIAPDGTLATVAGGGTNEANGIPATQAVLSTPSDVCLGPDGSLYISERWWGRVRRVGTDGRISTFAGGGCNSVSYDKCGIPAVEACLFSPEAIALARDGTLYIMENHWLRRVGSDGLINVFAGQSPLYGGYIGDGGPPLQARFYSPVDLAFGPDGSLYVPDQGNLVIRRIGPNLPGFGPSALGIASEDGGEVFFFDANGRHLRTANALNGMTLLSFEYDTAGRLTAVEDADHNRTIIERQPDGTPTAIVAPFGQRTALEVNTNGWLSHVTDPANQSYAFSYSSGGLLTALTDPRTNHFAFTYDSAGRLIKDENQACCFSELARVETTNGYSVTLTSPEGRQSSYRTEFPQSGGQRFVNTFPDGTRTEMLLPAPSTRLLTNADLTFTGEQDDGDPRFKMQSPFTKGVTNTTPGGLSYQLFASRSAGLTNAADLFSLRALTNTVTINGNTFSNQYDAAARTFTSTSPEGRQSFTVVDEQARPTQLEMPGLEPLVTTYDTHGRLAQTAQGARQSALSYDRVTGYLSSVTNALGEITAYQRDAVGRVATLTLPDGSDWTHAWDAKDNLTMLTEPNGTNHHQFTYTPQDLMETYRSPLGATETFTYNKDKELIRRQFPSGQALQWNYATNGQLASLQTPEGSHAFAYHAANGLLASATSRDGQQVDFAYDGSLLTSATWSGVVTGAVSYAYNNDFRVTQLAYAGLSLPLGYDGDGLLTNAGPISLTYNRTNGLLQCIADGAFTIACQRNEFGEITNTVASQGGELCRVDRSYDELGRIARKVETIAGATVIWDYTYDTVGQLVEVRRDGVAVEAYAYDAVGNRIGVTNTLTGETLTAGDYRYDADNRLLQAGIRTFTYDADGRVQTTRLSGVITTFHYNTDGTLAGVDLPGGKQITYLHDSRGRRIARTVNGVRTHAWLYGEGLMPLAEYDGNGALRTRFIYGGRWTPVAFVRNGATNHIVTDQLGSPRLVVDATGAVIRRVDYDASGNVVLDTAPALDMPFGFAGGMADPDQELIRFGARDFQPSTGRWTAKDPILIAGGWSLYGYVQGDPVNRLDVEGNMGAVIGVDFGPLEQLMGSVSEILGFNKRITEAETLDILQSLSDNSERGVSKSNKQAKQAMCGGGGGGGSGGGELQEVGASVNDFDVFGAWRLEKEAAKRAQEAQRKAHEAYWEHQKKKHPGLYNFYINNFVNKDKCYLDGAHNGVGG